MGTSGQAAVILKLSLPVSKSSVPDSATEFLNPENIGITIDISFLGVIDPEIRWG
jgi:hypothetical protein